MNTEKKHNHILKRQSAEEPESSKHKPFTKRKLLVIVLVLGLILVTLGIAGYFYFDGFSVGKYNLKVDSENDETDNSQNTETNAKEGEDETIEDKRNQWYGDDYFICEINNISDAKNALSFIDASIGDKIDLKNAANWEGGGMHYYKLTQQYDGMDVYGRAATVITNENNEVVGASSNCIAVGDISLDSSITGSEARDAATEYVEKKIGCDENDIDFGETDKVIYSIECDPVFCWRIEVSCLTETVIIFIDADNGDVVGVIDQGPEDSEEQITAKGQKDAKYNLNVFDYDGTDFLQDNERNIFVHSLDYNVDFENDCENDALWPKGSSELADISNKSGVDAMGNIATSYDYYKNHYNWVGYDGKGSPLNVYVKVCYKNYAPNAFWWGYRNSIYFTGSSNSTFKNLGVQLSWRLDVVAHEYTHAVTEYTSGLLYGSWNTKKDGDYWSEMSQYAMSSAAINESISDIMGEIIEKDATGTCDWKHGKSRDFKIESEYENGQEQHENAKFIDHIAYLIGNGQDDIDGYSKEDTMFFDAESNEAGDLNAYSNFWFAVQSSLPSTASLDQLATVAASIANSMLENGEISEAQYKGILHAFQKYGLDTDRKISNFSDEDSSKDIASCIVLAMDVSGSMNDEISTEKSDSTLTKLDVAKNSADTLIKQINSISNRYRDEFLLGLITFSDGAAIKAVPSNDMEYVKNAVKYLSANGGTNIASGINGACDVADITSNNTIILLSDGDDTDGNSDEDLLNLAKEAREENVIIYTIGFGSEGSFNEKILREIAETTGGKYSYANPQNAIDLVKDLLYVQADFTGEVVDEDEGTLSQGETSEEREFEIANKTGDMSALLYWPGSSMKTVLTDPDGKRVTEDYEGVTVYDNAIPTEIVVKDPKPGKWSVSIHAEQTSKKNEPYYSLISFRQFDRVSTDSIGTTEKIIAIILPIGIVLTLLSACSLLLFVNSKEKTQEL